MKFPSTLGKSRILVAASALVLAGFGGGATIERVETDSDGVYEAHITTEAGDEVTVQVDKSFAVTGIEAGGGHGDRDAADSSPAPAE